MIDGANNRCVRRVRGIPRPWYSISGALKVVLVLVMYIFLLHPGRFVKRYKYIEDYDIQKNLAFSRKPDSRSCGIVPNNAATLPQDGLFPWRFLPPSEFTSDVNATKVAKELKINSGGWWTPDDCEPRHDVAIVIPFRDRELQLNVFLPYIHRFLQKQRISYRIVVVEQSSGGPFNKGKLMNVGFKETLKIHQHPCFIFHDVDLIPQVVDNIYGCAKLPRHMSSSINTWRYNLLYNEVFGGVVAILAQQFERTNGFSHAYSDWGAEDDDFFMRVHKSGLEIVRFSPEISRYYMLPHTPQKKNPARFQILGKAGMRMLEDGLSSLEYQILDFRSLPLHTRIVVQS